MIKDAKWATTVRNTPWSNPYTWWTAIEVTQDKVINLILREENNLLNVNNNNELYCDLQLANWLKPTDTIPVWVTTGRVLSWDGRPVTWTLVCSKTTSWDVTMYLYWDNWAIYVNNWGNTWKILQQQLTAWTWILIEDNVISSTLDVIWETLYVYWNTDNNRWTLRSNREVSEIKENTVLRFIWATADHEIGDIYDNNWDSVSISSAVIMYSWVIAYVDCVWIIKDIEWDLTFYARYGWWEHWN